MNEPSPRLRRISIWLFALGLSLRLVIAASRIDRVWPDEHYQTLEPAFHVLNGYGVLAWEWLEGHRSWSLPYLHVPILGLAKLLGLGSGMAATVLARSVYAMADAWVWYRLVRWLIPSGGFQLLALSLVMLVPTYALWGVTTVQDHLAMLLFWGFYPTFHRWVVAGRHPFWAGLILFSIAIPKPQMGLLCLGTAAGGLWISRGTPHAGLSRVLLGAVGALSAGLLSGLLDWFTVGEFAGTLVRQVSRGEEISRFYGTSPTWDYLRRIPELVGVDGAVAMVGILAFAIAIRLWVRTPTYSRSTENSRTAEATQILLPGVVLYFGVHSLIPHKETRFLLPLLPVFLLGPVLLARLLLGQSRVPRLPKPGALLVVLTFATAASGFLALKRPVAYTSVEVGHLEEWIRVDWKQAHDPLRLKDPPRMTLCLVGHDWSFLRGSLGVGAPVEYVGAFSAEDFMRNRHRFSECHYAILHASRVEGFLKSEAGAGKPGPWQPAGASEQDFLLFKRALSSR
jgi:hypothetical protein